MYIFGQSEDRVNEMNNTVIRKLLDSIHRGATAIRQATDNLKIILKDLSKIILMLSGDY